MYWLPARIVPGILTVAVVSAATAGPRLDAVAPSVSGAQPAIAEHQLAAEPLPTAPRDGLAGILSEIRIGVLAHDHGPSTRNEERGIDGNLELLFRSPAVLEAIWAPRPHLGFSLNSAGDTDQLYAGLSWEWPFLGSWFAGFSLGGAVHDGETGRGGTGRKELGCRLLFRESVEVGYRFGGRHGLSAFLDHISNAGLCDANEGLETLGVRYGYRF